MVEETIRNFEIVPAKLPALYRLVIFNDDRTIYDIREYADTDEGLAADKMNDDIKTICLKG